MASSTPERRERRLECPVCLGAQMVTIRPEAGKPLVLDSCRRCGGVWFDAGEVAALRAASPRALWAHVALSPDAFRQKCHRCLASFRRNEPNCPACGRANILQCPRDGAALTRLTQDELTIDACPTCGGVWFDNVELAEIWNRTLTSVARRRPGMVQPASVDADHFLLFSMIWAPDVTLLAGQAAVGAVGALAPVADAAGAAAGAAVEATGELASGVFGAIADLLSGIFDSLG